MSKNQTVVTCSDRRLATPDWLLSDQFFPFFFGKKTGGNIMVIPSHMKKIYLGIISDTKILGIMSSGFQWFMCGVWLIFVSKIASPGCSTMPGSGQSVIKPRARDMVPMKYVVRVNGDPKLHGPYEIFHPGIFLCRQFLMPFLQKKPTNQGFH